MCSVLLAGSGRLQYVATMSAEQLLAIHPIVGARDLERAIAFYVERLGFELAFDDGNRPRNYVGLRRDRIVLHFQFQYEHEMATIRLRFDVADPDSLLREFQARGAFTDSAAPGGEADAARVALSQPLADKPWGTREFGFRDPEGNVLIFCRDLPR